MFCGQLGVYKSLFDCNWTLDSSASGERRSTLTNIEITDVSYAQGPRPSVSSIILYIN